MSDLHPRTRRAPLLALALVTLALAGPLLEARPALAKRGKSVANEAEWVAFDPAARTVTVEIRKKGQGNRDLIKQFRSTVKKGKKVAFNVVPTGSILTRTSVAINGMKGELSDIGPGKRVVVYWVEDPEAPGELFARKIDVVFSEEELEARYPDAEE